MSFKTILIEKKQKKNKVPSKSQSSSGREHGDSAATLQEQRVRTL
jgi:hypothetical protein